MRVPKAAASGLALAFAAVSAVVAVALPAHAATTLVVNADQPFRPVTHVATGSLYGLASATVPSDSLVEPLPPPNTTLTWFCDEFTAAAPSKPPPGGVVVTMLPVIAAYQS